MPADRTIAPFTCMAIRFAAFAASFAMGACGGGAPSAPTPADALDRITSSRFVDFKYASGDAVDGNRQDAYHEWALGALGLQTSRRLQYAKYRDAGHMRRVTGQMTNGFAEPSTFTVHSIWPWDAHEAVHVYTELIGRPSDFFNEGIAVALSYDPAAGRFVALWNNTPIHDVARSLTGSGTVTSIGGIVDTEAFRRLPDQQSYPLAGSFVSFLIDDRGMPAMLAFFRASSRADSRAIIDTRFTSAFGFSVAEGEQRWRAFLSRP